MIYGTPSIVTNGLIFNIDTLNTKSVNTPIVNLSPPLENWTTIRSKLSLVTGGTITPPIEGIPVYKLTCDSSLFINTLHRLTNNSIVGTIGNRFYQYSMYVRGDETNNPTANIQIDISDGAFPNNKIFHVGTGTTWNKISVEDLNPPNLPTNNWFDFSMGYGNGQLANNSGDTYYISGIVIARSLGTDNNTYKPLLEDPGYIPYNGIINTGITDMVNSNNVNFIPGKVFNGTYGGLSIYTSGETQSNMIMLPNETNLPEWSLSYWFRPIIRDERNGLIGNLTYASGTTTYMYNSIGRFTGMQKPYVDSNYNYYLGSQNEQFQNVSRYGVVKVNSGGTVVTEFNTNQDPQGAKDFSILGDNQNNLYVAGTNVFFRRYNINTGVQTGVFANFSTSLNLIPCIVDEPNNHIYLSGDFITVSGLTRQRLTRFFLNSFTPDLSLNTSNGFNGLPERVLKHQNKLICLGRFTSYSGVPRNYITRINLDGTLDETFQVGSGFNNILNFDTNPKSMVIDSNDRIIIGGRFTTYSGIPRQHLVRLNPDGSLDETFQIGSGFNERVYDVAVQSDDKIIVVGLFTTYSGISRNRVIRLNTDGTIDNTFNMGNGVRPVNNPSFGTVDYVSVQNDGKVVLFNGVPNQILSYSSDSITWTTMIRLDPDGSFDNTFNAGVGYTKSIYRSDFIFRYLTTANTLTTFIDFNSLPTIGNRRPLQFFNDYYSKGVNRVFTKDNNNVLRYYENGVLFRTYSFNPAEDLNLRMRQFNLCGDISSIQIHNRSITPDEVTKNFNALRTRYNI